MALLAAALAWLAAAAGRLLLAFAEGGMFVGPVAVVIPWGPAWPGREPGRRPAGMTARASRENARKHGRPGPRVPPR